MRRSLLALLLLVACERVTGNGDVVHTTTIRPVTPPAPIPSCSPIDSCVRVTLLTDADSPVVLEQLADVWYVSIPLKVEPLSPDITRLVLQLNVEAGDGRVWKKSVVYFYSLGGSGVMRERVHDWSDLEASGWSYHPYRFEIGESLARRLRSVGVARAAFAVVPRSITFANGATLTRPQSQPDGER